MLDINFVISSRGICVMFNIAFNERTSCRMLQVCIPLVTDHILMVIVTGFLMRSKLCFSSSLRVDVFM
jgi:hypothetical protein